MVVYSPPRVLDATMMEDLRDEGIKEGGGVEERQRLTSCSGLTLGAHQTWHPRIVCECYPSDIASQSWPRVISRCI